jgi:hypothetical protein
MKTIRFNAVPSEPTVQNFRTVADGAPAGTLQTGGSVIPVPNPNVRLINNLNSACITLTKNFGTATNFAIEQAYVIDKTGSYSYQTQSPSGSVATTTVTSVRLGDKQYDQKSLKTCPGATELEYQKRFIVPCDAAFVKALQQTSPADLQRVLDVQAGKVATLPNFSGRNYTAKDLKAEVCPAVITGELKRRAELEAAERARQAAIAAAAEKARREAEAAAAAAAAAEAARLAAIAKAEAERRAAEEKRRQDEAAARAAAEAAARAAAEAAARAAAEREAARRAEEAAARAAAEAAAAAAREEAARRAAENTQKLQEAIAAVAAAAAEAAESTKRTQMLFLYGGLAIVGLTAWNSFRTR